MSYLSTPRINFSGTFYTDPSTVNNLAVNYQKPKPGESPPADWDNEANWNWNPKGKHSFEIRDCTIISVQTRNDGLIVDPKEHDLIGVKVTHIGKTPAKLGGLDVVQQYLPSVWGLELSFGGLFSGTMKHVAACDQWYRNHDPSLSAGDFNTTARFQSVLTDIKTTSPDATELFGASDVGGPLALSINFVLDGFYGKTDSTDPRYLTGRIVGSTARAMPGEPDHFIAGRLLRPQPVPKSIWQGNPLYFTPFVVDSERKKLIIDLGNSIPRTAHGESPLDVGDLEVSVTDHHLGSVHYKAATFEKAASIQEFDLTDEQYAQIGRQPVQISQTLSGKSKVLLAEDPEGRLVRADQFVYRSNPGETSKIDLYARRFGQPAKRQSVTVANDAKKIAQYQLFEQATRDPKKTIIIPIGSAADGVLNVPASVTTDDAGRATFSIKALKSPGGPRLGGAVDGQIYGVSYEWPGLENPNPQDYVSIRVFDSVTISVNPQWSDVEPILGLYARLYPAMTAILDLSKEEVVRSNARLIQQVLSLPMDDASYMPVHRELSRDKLALILKWLDSAM